ncbi:hypothetical protein DSL92_06245 [Billgrantia gudaonensis]|uniref:Uncharacterized protein n=1 Tax=Billgrantia gudaonensis TaxID=376427 RepID=A0A432JIS2_9GAMM|nr:hypothetical protein DSL92_06245 [Halomonas gudaonensis]
MRTVTHSAADDVDPTQPLPSLVPQRLPGKKPLSLMLARCQAAPCYNWMMSISQPSSARRRSSVAQVLTSLLAKCPVHRVGEDDDECTAAAVTTPLL